MLKKTDTTPTTASVAPEVSNTTKEAKASPAAKTETKPNNKPSAQDEVLKVEHKPSLAIPTVAPAPQAQPDKPAEDPTALKIRR